MTRDEAMRQIAALNRASWLSAHPGASETDYQAAGILAAAGGADPQWRGDADGPLMGQIQAILAQIEE